jgi:hypothetical protein
MSDLPSGFGETTGLHAENIRLIQDTSEVFWNDLTSFIRMNSMLEEHEHDQLATEVPVDFTWQTNTELNVLEPYFVAFKAMQRLGAHLVIVGEEGDRDQKIQSKDYVAVYSDPKQLAQRMLTGDLRQAKGDDQEPGFEVVNKLLDSMMPRTDDTRLNEINALGIGEPARQHIREDGLVERAFMTRLLRAAPKYLTRSLGSQLNANNFEASMWIYEDFYKRDIRPLGVEEVYGLATSAIQNYIRRHPEKTYWESAD